MGARPKEIRHESVTDQPETGSDDSGRQATSNENPSMIYLLSHLSICLHVHLPVHQSVSPLLSACLSVSPSINMSVCPFIIFPSVLSV
jgi:hypothetical protein